MKKFIFALITLILLFTAECSADCNITMFNVGHGDSIFIQADNDSVLIDTGNDLQKLSAELNRAGIFKIDKLILTHPHADHIGCASYIIDNYNVQTVYDNGLISTSPLYLAYKNKNINQESLKAGDTLQLSASKFIVFNPIENFSYGKINNESIVCKFIYNDFSMLLTGDIEMSTEAELVYRNNNLKANVLKAPHHGSKSSSNLNFLRAVKPSTVIISASEKFNFPNDSAIAAYFAVKSKNILCTRYNGTIYIHTDGLTHEVTSDYQSDWLDNFRNKNLSVISTTKL